jgi:hypothetical protein
MRCGVDALPHVLKAWSACIGARRQNLSCLRETRVCRQSPGHSSLLVVYTHLRDTTAVGIFRLQARRRNRTHPPRGILLLGSPRPSKGAISGVGRRRCAEAPGTAYTLPRLALAHTQPWQPLRVFALSQSLCHCFAFFSSLYLPKTASAALAKQSSIRRFDLVRSLSSHAGKIFPSPKPRLPTR